ncbi:MAG: hypothetical protein GY906_16705 [bacterium]|nr:hypothetical protein [bacterium]
MSNDIGSSLPVVAVLGGSMATDEQCAAAFQVGSLVAERGWVVLTGGGPGVMESACRGAVDAGGLTVAILPTSGPTDNYPNRWVRLPIYTGAGMARNAFNVLSARLCIAIGGEGGTLSEIGMCLKAGVPVWCWDSWSVVHSDDASRTHRPKAFETVDLLLAELETYLSNS